MKKKIGLFLGILAVAVCCVGLYQLHLTRKAGFIVEEHLEDVLLTVGKEEVTIRDALYYIMLVENESNERAEEYSEEAKKSFWNIKTGDEGYVSQVAKKVILQQLIKDEILYQEAVKNGWEIEEKEVENAVVQIWAEMSPYQKELTGYTKEMLRERLEKAYAGQVYSEVYGEDFEAIKEEYQVTIDEKLWESLAIGRVTIQNEEEKK